MKYEIPIEKYTKAKKKPSKLKMKTTLSDIKIRRFKLPALPYAYDALEPYVDSKTIEIHHDMHHACYIKAK